VSDSSPCTYHRESDAGACFYCKEFAKLFRALGPWYCVNVEIVENIKVKADSTPET